MRKVDGTCAVAATNEIGHKRNGSCRHTRRNTGGCNQHAVLYARPISTPRRRHTWGVAPIFAVLKTSPTGACSRRRAGRRRNTACLDAGTTARQSGAGVDLTDAGPPAEHSGRRCISMSSPMASISYHSVAHCTLPWHLNQFAVLALINHSLIHKSLRG